MATVPTHELPKLPDRPFKKPRACLDPHDPDWIHQSLGHLQFLYGVQTTNVTDLLTELDRLVDVKAWTLYPPEHPYGSFDAMIRAALGCTLDEFFAELERRKIALKAKTAEPEAEVGYPEGRPNGLEDSATTDDKGNHDNAPRGTGTDYILGRLARDNQELLDRVKNGELSPNAAAVLAGIRKPESPITAAVRALKKMTDDEVREFEAHFAMFLESRGLS